MLLLTTSLLVTLLVSTSAQFTFPAGTRNGHNGEVRFFNQFSATTATFGTPATAFTGNVVATLKVTGSPDQQLGSVAAGFGAFQDVDLKTARTGIIEIRHQSTAGQLLCSVNVGANVRTTVSLTQTVNNNVQTGNCQIGGTATGTSCQVSTPSTVSFTCTTNVPTVSTRQCDLVPLRVQRFDERTCPLRIRRTSGLPSLDAGESVLLDKKFTAADESVDLQRKWSFEFEDFAGTAIDGAARSYEAVATSATAVGVTKYETAFINVINAAHRVFLNTASAKQLDNTFDIVVTEGTNVEHVKLDLATNTFAGWIEVEAGKTYSIDVYSGRNSEATIFGTGTLVGTKVSATISNIVANSFHVAAIETASTTVGVSPTNIKVTAFDVTPGATNAGDTTFDVYNLIAAPSVKLAAPTTTCCNILNNNVAITSGAKTTVTASELTKSFQGETTFNIYGSTASCGDLGAAQGSVALTSSISGTSCGKRVFFLTGRQYTVTRTVTGCTTCTGTETRIGDLNFIDNAGSGNTAVVVSLDLPICSCTPVATCAATLDCATDAAFTALDAKIDSVNSAVAGVVSSLPPDTTANFAALNRAVTQSRANTVGLINANQAQLLDVLEDLADDVEDVGEEAEDAVDEAGDAEKLAKQAANQSKKNFQRIKDTQRGVAAVDTVLRAHSGLPVAP